MANPNGIGDRIGEGLRVRIVERPEELPVSLLVVLFNSGAPDAEATVLNRMSATYGPEFVERLLAAGSVGAPEPVPLRESRVGAQNILVVFDNRQETYFDVVTRILGMARSNDLYDIAIVPPELLGQSDSGTFSESVGATLAAIDASPRSEQGEDMSVTVVLPNTKSALDYMRAQSDTYLQ